MRVTQQDDVPNLVRRVISCHPTPSYKLAMPTGRKAKSKDMRPEGRPRDLGSKDPAGISGRMAKARLRDGWLGYDLLPMVKKTASIEEVLADEVKSLTKLGIPKAMAYQMIASRFHQKVGNQEEAEPDPFEGNATSSWEEIG